MYCVVRVQLSREEGSVQLVDWNCGLEIKYKLSQIPTNIKYHNSQNLIVLTCTNLCSEYNNIIWHTLEVAENIAT